GSWLAALFILLTICFYVLVYSLVLKRRTAQNVVWGGAAGCMPVLVSWAVITDNVEMASAGWWQAIVLFLFIFFWTPPHTWALAMRYKDDYQAAGVPMLPVVMSPEGVTRRITIYTWVTVLCTFALIPAAGWVYAAGAAGFGIWFIVMAHKLEAGVRRGVEVKPLKLFMLSNNYLAGVFVALSVAAVLGRQTISDMLPGVDSPPAARWVSGAGRLPAPPHRVGSRTTDPVVWRDCRERCASAASDKPNVAPTLSRSEPSSRP